MGRRIFLTGVTGALGPGILRELLGNGHVVDVLIRDSQSESTLERCARICSLLPDGLGQERVRVCVGDVRCAGLGMSVKDSLAIKERVQVVVHAASDSRFRAPAEELALTNVDGVRNVLEWARQCPRIEQVLLLSTTCVAGTRTGLIGEEMHREEVEFTNEYERTKWQGEQLAADSSLPVRIARLSTVIGSRDGGLVRRPGAIHHALRWLERGLIPMIPGTREAPVDLIDEEGVASWVVRACAQPPQSLEVCQVAAGKGAVPLGEMLDFIVGRFREQHSVWRRGQIEKPMIVPRLTFERFQEVIRSSGDALFAQVLDSVSSFLPALQHPKVYATERAEAIHGGRLPFAKPLATLSHVLNHGSMPRVRS